jgi:hypothetical protein
MHLGHDHLVKPGMTSTQCRSAPHNLGYPTKGALPRPRTQHSCTQIEIPARTDLLLAMSFQNQTHAPTHPSHLPRASPLLIPSPRTERCARWQTRSHPRPHRHHSAARTALPEEYIWTSGDITIPRSDRNKFPWPRQQLRIDPHYFRSTFSVDATPSAATIYVAGPRSAKVYLNGKLAASFNSDIDAPIGFHVFHADVAKLLHPGTNTLAIEAVRGRGIVAAAGGRRHPATHLWRSPRSQANPRALRHRSHTPRLLQPHLEEQHHLRSRLVHSQKLSPHTNTSHRTQKPPCSFTNEGIISNPLTISIPAHLPSDSPAADARTPAPSPRVDS